MVVVNELWALSLPRADPVGTLLIRRVVELARLSSSLTDDLAMLCLWFLSELLASSVVFDFMDDGFGLFFLGFLVVVVDDDDDDGILG